MIPELVHPKDPTLRFPLVKDELDTPEKMIESLFKEYIEGRQSFDPIKNILYRKYEDHYRTDSISCHFTETIRVHCRTSNYPNLVQIWKSMDPAKIRSFKSIDDLRSFMLYQMGAKECNFFNPALCMRLYLGYNKTRAPIKILDPSAGWGDRMITAIACGDLVSEYHGYDTNKDLEAPYQEIIDRLDSYKKCKFYIQPFQMAHIQEGYFDLAMTSPPYFNLEVYSEDVDQSYNETTRDYASWKDRFYIPYLKNMVKGVKVGGRVILYVSNYRDINKDLIPLADDTVKIVTSMNTKRIVTGEYRTHRKDEVSKGFPRPYYVFHKIA